MLNEKEYNIAMPVLNPQFSKKFMLNILVFVCFIPTALETTHSQKNVMKIQIFQHLITSTTLNRK